MGDVAQAQTQLETTRAQLRDLGVPRAQFEHAIAVLIGKAPAGFAIPPAPLQSLPPVTPVGIPSALLERRPDIAAGERQVAAANEEIGVAKAALYPAILLTAEGGTETANLLKLFTGPSYLWSIGGQLAQTLFDKGKRRAQIALTQANYDTTVASYRQTVLSAFQQVEDNLAALRILAEEAGIEDRAVTAAQESLKISTAQYQGGIASYLQVITTQTIAQQDQRAAVDIQTRRMVASVSLIQALGGGWDTSKLPPG
jgi:NodT family efflux transporter outer membrane factor (OMF) lipoprotein